jgi:hypothetical protein
MFEGRPKFWRGMSSGDQGYPGPRSREWDHMSARLKTHLSAGLGRLSEVFLVAELCIYNNKPVPHPAGVLDSEKKKSRETGTVSRPLRQPAAGEDFFLCQIHSFVCSRATISMESTQDQGARVDETLDEGNHSQEVLNSLSTYIINGFPYRHIF